MKRSELIAQLLATNTNETDPEVLISVDANLATIHGVPAVEEFAPVHAVRVLSIPPSPVAAIFSPTPPRPLQAVLMQMDCNMLGFVDNTGRVHQHSDHR